MSRPVHFVLFALLVLSVPLVLGSHKLRAEGHNLSEAGTERDQTNPDKTLVDDDISHDLARSGTGGHKRGLAASLGLEPRGSSIPA